MSYGDEEKKYQIVGKVEIGTNEYRDLIEKCMKLEKESSENRSLYWKEQTRANDNAKEAKLAKEQLQEYKNFIIDDGLEKQFKEYRIAKLDEQNEDENN